MGGGRLPQWRDGGETDPVGKERVRGTRADRGIGVKISPAGWHFHEQGGVIRPSGVVDVNGTSR
jgi:hypothetical protein